MIHYSALGLVAAAASLNCASAVMQEFKVDSALSHNDAVVASGSEDGSIYLWDLVRRGASLGWLAGGRRWRRAAVLTSCAPQ